MFGPFGGSPGGTESTVLYQGHPPVNLHYRPLQHSDYDALKAIHRELFPIDYEEVFFRKAVAGEDRVFSWAALHNEYGRDHLVGFVTARVVYLYECDPTDRQVMGLSAKCMDGECTVYVLTLGVVPACRQCGIARSLLGLVQQHAARLRCRAIFLHVISYNNAAMRLYGTSGYQAMARLPNFYHLVAGRQPNPDQSWYDAFLYALFIAPSGPEPSPAMQWAGGVLGAAVAPLRSMLVTFNGCMPSWFCRQTYSTFLPFASTTLASASQRSASKGSLADTATSVWRQQQQQQPLPSPQQPVQQRAPSPAATAAQYSRQLSQSQQTSIPTSTVAGVVCAGVTAEQFLKQQHHHHQQQQQQQQHQWRCTGGERRSKEWGGYGQQGPAGSSSSGTEWSGSQVQVQQQYPTAGSNSNGTDSGAGGSSAASSASVSGDLHQHHPLRVATLPPAAVPAPAPYSQFKHQNQHPQMYDAPVLRPPSPSVPPSLTPSITSLQQRHPHNIGNGSASPYIGWGGQSIAQPRSHLPLQHSLQGSHGQQYSSGPSRASHGRTGEHARGGIPRPPHGLAGGSLSSVFQQQQSQQQQQQQRGSVLTSLFRPPTVQSHPHSR